MSKSQQRLFVNNLPPNTREQELQNEFSAYGSVKKVEIKHKKHPDTEEILSTFAFITIDIEGRAIQQCIQEFKQEQYRGRYLQVSVARENFLEKLKREREEATQNQLNNSTTSAIAPANNTSATSLPNFKTNTKPKSSSSSSEESSSDDEPEPAKTPTISKPANGIAKTKRASTSSSSSSSSDSSESEDDGDLIMRRKSKTFLENGKIKIDHTVSGGKAIHVIEKNPGKTVKKQFDAKSQKADEKRLKSLNKMKDSYTQQKQAIKAALASVDASKKSNKIIFNDSDNEESTPIKTPAVVVSKTAAKKANEKRNLTLFDDGDDSDQEDYGKGFAIKEQFQGAKGEKLMKLQSRFQNDARFKMDSRFLDDINHGENDGDADEGVDDSAKTSHTRNGEQTAYDDERQWQYNILESVMGKKVNQGPSNTSKDTKKKAPQTMLRFDPARSEHTKFIEAKKRKAPKPKEDKSDAKRFKDDNEFRTFGNNLPEVSSDQYFKVSDRLKGSIGSSTGFSLLQMFGRNNEKEQSNVKNVLQTRYQEIPIAKNAAKGLADFHPFNYDSSDDEANDKKASKENSLPILATKTGKIWHEPFFMLDSKDSRFSEGLSLFIAPERKPEDEQEKASKQQELRNIVKKKIKKSVKNSLPRHAKPNKRFKQMTRNF